MSTPLKQPLFSLLLAVLLVPATLLAVPTAQNEKAPQMGENPHHHGMTQKHGAMMKDCEAMMAERKQVHEKMQAMDAKLDEMVSRMQQASGEQKTEQLAAIVAELVSQRRQMHQQTWGHHAHMMQHMMTHMQAMHLRMMEGMEGCPMMQGTPPGDQPREDPDESGGASHEEHHP